jgi:hypothetical protein
VAEQLGKRVALLEGELRAAKRRETKLAATHFRLRQDLASADGDLKCVVSERHSAVELREYTRTVTLAAPMATSSAQLQLYWTKTCLQGEGAKCAWRTCQPGAVAPRWPHVGSPSVVSAAHALATCGVTAASYGT